ncbi:hypothetical protein BCR36DRAFT_588235 [Piromyces finnis]|uniref:Uncharacterized protein n=1 Tax=Piromyces finnis TaxID=1754191 RepID=A0A1Y1UN82_9FUNG|nr:hypothetical protein BCR36DRAFT_588235 [Piromyces finnis]|eukprot:ORX39518.1 hypothetical protein BCR36DRAFT_588235 [Piromyces finnis]
MNDDDYNAQRKSVRERLQEKIGFCPKAAAGAFFKSINLGNDTDWQPFVELLIDNPKLKLS